MLKSIAMTPGECTAKQENKTSCNTDYVVPGLIDFFGDNENRSKHKRNIRNCKKYCTD